MNKHYRALELNKILDMLADGISCDEGAALAREIEPSHDIEEVRSLLTQTYDAHMLIGRYGSPSLGGLKNVSSSLRRAEAGASLSMAELLRISRVLGVIRSLKEWRSRGAGTETSLDDFFNSIIANKYLEDKINLSILSEDEMADSASKELTLIRKKIRTVSARARDQLEKIVRSASTQKYLQDSIITMRDGRFVVPVKQEFRSNVPGLVHDTSSSGATVFVEPMSVVEANNEIKVLLAKERDEIERILAELSAEAGTFADSIIKSVQTATQLSVIFGKANLAYKMQATLPKLNDNGFIYLNKARHPLIDPKKVVAATVELGKDFDTLIITGPNTGGKTVSLKLIGLLTLMAMCGLMIPAGDNSEISVFNNVLVDIGDEQSIEQSLSTFSAHMTNIISILEKTDYKSLVLLDELGSGTDPVEGAALAVSIIEDIRSRGAILAATTHYAELKEYALNTKNVENGSCEFDVNTLRPTYRLLIGVPGRSNAFAISQRLGLDNSIIEHAQRLVSAEDRRFESVVEKFEERRQQLEKNLKEADESIRRARQAQKEAEEKLRTVEEKASKEIETAKLRAAEIVEETERKAYDLLDELEEQRKNLQDLTGDKKAKLRAKINAMGNTSAPTVKSNEGYVLPRAIKAGDTVLIVDIDKKANVIEAPANSDTVLVQAGIFKTRVKLSNLRLIESEKVTVTRNAERTIKKNIDVKAITEVDLRGKTADEAIMELDSALDSAILSGIHQMTVIHGKGTGVLRREVQNFLRHHKAIKSFRLGVYGEGESGVTIAELK